MPCSRGSSQPRDWTHVSYVAFLGRHVLYPSTTGEAHLGLWGFSKFSGNEILHEEAPRAELTVCSPATLTFWAQWEPSLTNSTGRGQAPGGDCGFQDTSLFPLLCPSFLQWVDASGTSGTPRPPKLRLHDIPWRLSGELPSPQLRNVAQPHRSGRHALNITQRALWRQGRHTLPQTWGS